MAKKPRKRIGKYEILAQISSGGMAEVFLAVVPGPAGFRKFIALKRILPALRRDADFVKMFLDEARITASLSHSSIGQVLDLGIESSELFLAMEYIPGRDLRRIRHACAERNTRLPLGFSARVAKDICLALHYAHRFVDPSGTPAPVIHRDVSASNVMVTYAGNVKVIDFGVAKAKGSLQETRAGRVKGTRGYLSPEQATGRPLDGRSDLFSAGALLHEMLTGTQLFASENDLQSLHRLLIREMPRPSETNPEVPAALDEVVMKALGRAPEDRFADGREMAKAIERAVGAELFDDDAVAAQLAELFPDHLSRTRALLGVPFAAADALRDAAAALYEDQPAPVAASTSTDAGGAGAAPKESGAILAVDDSEIVRELIRGQLENEGYRVHTAGSAADALQSLSKELPALVLLDVMMPEMDGFELCRRIRERTPGRHLPILFVSSSCSLEERLRGLTVGGDDFIRKPYEPEELAGRVKAHLQRVAFLGQLAAR